MGINKYFLPELRKALRDHRVNGSTLNVAAQQRRQEIADERERHLENLAVWDQQITNSVAEGMEWGE